MSSTTTITHDLVLIGGGHSHALVLRRMGMKPWPANVRLTLVTNLADTPYSGMLPCHISGLYDFDTAHIDLRPLTRFANCRLIMDTVVRLDPTAQTVLCKDHPPIPYDSLSIDVGSTPTKSQVPGAAEYAIPAKPVPALLRQWHAYLDTLERALQSSPQTTTTIGIVGGGVGGVEMAFAMQIRLWQLVKRYSQDYRAQVAVHIFHRGTHLAKGRNQRTQRLVEKLCRKRGIYAHTQESVSEVTPEAVLCKSGLSVKCDRTFWVTHAAAPPWLQKTGLSLTDDGFIAVRDTLQTLSHPNVFAAGDVATMVNHQRPKAGVFAVRQGPPLYKNLLRQVTGQSLKPFKPQRRYLNIIDTTPQRAIASWGPFAIHARWCRQWKHRIDTKFMSLFSDFPEMTEKQQLGAVLSSQTTEAPEMHCTGCGSKVGANTLQQALSKLQATAPDNKDWPRRDRIYTGLTHPDDAAIVDPPLGELAVHTLDYFSALIDDPYRFGQIAANHCLSDLFAMGATPHTVLAMVTLPYATSEKQADLLYQLLAGAQLALNDAKAFLVGGHTTEGPGLSLGFSCNGWIKPDHIWQKGGLAPGNQLILTKALGTGSLFAADQQLKAKGRWIESAVAQMCQSNRAAADCLRQHGATACTDVTGFGLAGHLLEMLSAAGMDATVSLDAIASLPGVLDTLSQGIVSSLHSRNQHHAMAQIIAEPAATTQLPFQLLFDPQTSGGLLASIPIEQVDACLAALRDCGYVDSRRIGEVHSRTLRRSNVTQPLTITR